MVLILCCHTLDQEHILTTNESRRRSNLSKQNEIINEELAGLPAVTGDSSKDKKEFVEPAISAPVDVLEATTFFQASTSGPTNP